MVFFAGGAKSVSSSCSNLSLDGKVLCEDSSEYMGKSYWGNGHTRTLVDYYSDSKFSLEDIKDIMNLMFGIYESAEQGSVKLK